MNQLNVEFDGKLSLAIEIFEGRYHRKFMLQLISSQLDMDRLDYLKRDSFYTGVAEGNINSDRIIQMLNVVDDVLVLEEKGIYSIEKFIMARRLMYWQAYLHKTSLVAELILTKILKRVKEIYELGEEVECSKPLLYFIKNKIEISDFSNEALSIFTQLDDFDVISAIKNWQFHKDIVLSSLSKMLINRDLLKIRLSSEKIDKSVFEDLKIGVSEKFNISKEEATYFVFKGKIKNQAYSNEAEPIRILRKDKTIENIIEASDQFNTRSVSKEIIKYYVCFPKQLI
jgi:hypothetical protein